MRIERKKVIAKEFLLFLGVIFLGGFISLSIWVYSLSCESKYKNLSNEEYFITQKIDSIGKPRMSSVTSDDLPIFKKQDSIQEAAIRLLSEKLTAVQSQKTEIFNNIFFVTNTETATINILAILFIVLYPARALIYAIKWSIKTLRIPPFNNQN